MWTFRCTLDAEATQEVHTCRSWGATRAACPAHSGSGAQPCSPPSAALLAKVLRGRCPWARHRTEDLLSNDLRVGSNIRQNRRWVLEPGRWHRGLERIGHAVGECSISRGADATPAAFAHERADRVARVDGRAKGVDGRDDDDVRSRPDRVLPDLRREGASHRFS